MAGAKEDEVYVMLPANGSTGWGIEGVFFRDTAIFTKWAWSFGDAHRLSQVASGNLIQELHALTQADRSQSVGLERRLLVNASGFQDQWTLKNTSCEVQSVTLCLDARTGFNDLFAARMAPQIELAIKKHRNSSQSISYSNEAKDGVVHLAIIRCDAGLADNMSWTMILEPGAIQTLDVEVEIHSSDHNPIAFEPLPSYASWRAAFGVIAGKDFAVDQAIDDLRSLLLRTEYGPYPAAGMPIFVNFFGRDALITALMLLDWQPPLLRSVLSFLAAHKGQIVDPFREEEPGKILHEVRRGELSRTNQIPFGRYYGSVDSTPLFLMAADAYLTAHWDAAFAAQIRPAIEAATNWLVSHLSGLSGLATFSSSGSGLVVQSWKDSPNSMLDEYGKPATQPLAVAEVQGYAYAALLAAARLLPDRADALNERAAALRQAFHLQFWLPEQATYAMALDAEMKPLRVLSSDPGHLLWVGIVPEEIAPILVTTLLSEAMWSGWGLRTLGANEVAYNPVSYHNGSVWPHDTGIFAMGLARYGFESELRVVAQALLDLAAASPGRQMPELISGFDRATHREPVAYTHANAPQSWSAATVVRMAAYLASPWDAA